jgi:hypothetical protein
MPLNIKSTKGFTRRDFIKTNIATTAVVLSGAGYVKPAKATVDTQNTQRISKFLIKQIFQTIQTNQPFSVMVSISGNGDAKNKIASYVNQQLGGLNDVIIAEKYPCFYEIEFKVLEQENIPGCKTGVTLSTIFLQKADVEAFQKILTSLLTKEKPIDNNTNEIIDQTFASFIETWGYVYNVKNHYLDTVPDDGLEELCKRIVNDFDSECLEPTRVFKRFIEKIKNNKTQ